MGGRQRRPGTARSALPTGAKGRPPGRAAVTASWRVGSMQAPLPADRILDVATRIADQLLEVQTRVNGQIDAALAELLPGVQQRLGVDQAEDVDLSGLVNARITGLSVVVTPAAVAAVVPLSAASAATTAAGRRVMTDIVSGDDDRLAVIAGPCSIHDPAAAVEYAAFLARMRE